MEVAVVPWRTGQGLLINRVERLMVLHQPHACFPNLLGAHDVPMTTYVPYLSQSFSVVDNKTETHSSVSKSSITAP